MHTTVFSTHWHECKQLSVSRSFILNADTDIKHFVLKFDQKGLLINFVKPVKTDKSLEVDS